MWYVSSPNFFTSSVQGATEKITFFFSHPHHDDMTMKIAIIMQDNRNEQDFYSIVAPLTFVVSCLGKIGRKIYVLGDKTPIPSHRLRLPLYS
jgi:hypothetical protein